MTRILLVVLIAITITAGVVLEDGEPDIRNRPLFDSPLKSPLPKPTPCSTGPIPYPCELGMPLQGGG